MGQISDMKEYMRKYHKAYMQIPENRIKTKIRHKILNTNIKRKVIDHYGNKCSTCGITQIEFLELDHINGGGTSWTKKTNIRGVSFYKWVISNNYPSDLQLLCSNCNWIKWILNKSSNSTGKWAVYSKKRHDTIKEKIFGLLGSICECCGETNKICLTIDHKNNDGALERKLYGGQRGIYWKIANNLLPLNNYQILCRNCNCSKGRHGKCPHSIRNDNNG